MNNKDQKNTKEKTAAYIAAVNEAAIYPKNLLQEIIPLLQEYFFGEFNIDANSINMSFLNGQKFHLTVGEVI